jgi:hypothetical protein
MIEKLRRGGRWVVLEVEVENERTEQRGRRRDSETGAASQLKKKTLALARQGMLIYEGGEGKRGTIQPCLNGRGR